MTEDIKAELTRLAAAAKAQGRLKTYAVALAALQRIEALERSWRDAFIGGQRRSAVLSPERRHEIARQAAQARWQRST